MANLIVYPKFQAFDNNGDPLAGGYVYTYISGTLTPKITYTDSGGGTQNSNPVQLDARGEASIWLDSDAAYTFIITDSSLVPIDTVDNIIGFQAITTGGIAMGGDLQIKNYSITDASSPANEYFKFSTTSNAVNEFTITNAATGTRPKITLSGGDTNVSGEFKAKGTGGWILSDGNGNEVFITAAGTASAVNEITVTNAATGNAPSIAATGGDTNAGIIVKGKGTGPVRLGQATSTDVRLEADQPIADSSGNEYLKFSKTASAVNEFTVTNAATGNGVSLLATGDDTNIDATFGAKGSTGKFKFKSGGVTFTAPSADGLAGQSLKTDAAGTLSFSNSSYPAGGRLTLTTATPVTTADVSAAGTIYYTPYIGNKIALYDGSTGWAILTFSELSIAVPATGTKMHDVFIYNNSGTAALEVLAWTNDTTRATGLVYQDGVLVKSGATTRRYLGSFRTIGASQCSDAVAFRHLWNYYNRVTKYMTVRDTTDSWTYSTGSFRQANNSAGNQLDFCIGVAEDFIFARASSLVNCSDAANGDAGSGIGFDSTTTQSAFLVNKIKPSNVSAKLFTYSEYMGNPAAGRHFLAWLEIAPGGTATETWYGDDAGSTLQNSGISGFLRC